ncbi:MAG TPA: oligosaccharide flippase family protein [Paludibaculum sp.]
MQADLRGAPPLSPPSSLRAGFAWTLAGNAIYAASQWGLLSILAKLGGRDVLGEYALAVALTAPVAMLAHLNLRAVLATDVSGQRRFRDYISLRLVVSGLALAAMAVMAAVFGRSAGMAAVIFLTGLGQTSETISDAYYGAMQRRDEMDRIARSMMTRGILSAAAFAAALWLTGELVWAVAAAAAGRLLVLAVYDRRIGSADEASGWAETSWSGARSILRQALPLGGVLMLVSLNTNLPRYVIERQMGVGELGAFAAVASFVTAGSTIVNALGQAATPKLARLASMHEPANFLRLAAKLGALVFGLGVAGVACAALLGKVVLTLAYRPEYAAYSGLLVGVMGAAIPGYVAAALGYAVTAARAFDAQVPMFCIVAASCGYASWLLVPRLGLSGAVVAMAVAAAAQIGGQALILRRALRQMEATA